MEENQTNQIVLLQNCIKQYQVLLSALKGYLQNICKDGLGYYEVKDNLFSAIKMICTTEELMKVYNDKDKDK